ncbi:MAG: hypothetical protein ABIQ27_00210 [Flavobacterium sp.]|uniref:hypothetical protein n=1 Tax=Flavobacterium sp. TaxID=239 RepID=UPI003266A0A5
MKNLITALLLIFLFSCSGQKNNNTINPKANSAQSNLTETESNIVNEFLGSELKKDRYKNYKDYEVFLIEEAVKKTKSIYAYEYTYKNFYKREREREYWILDSVQIKRLKSDLETEKQYYWKISDFKNTKVSLYKYQELRTIIKTGAYVNLPKRLIIFLSKPLIINESTALISFDIGNGTLGNNEITHFTVLMKKNEKKWIAKDYFEDGAFQ